jgi:geranylgeranyl diphosphate synthase type II
MRNVQTADEAGAAVPPPSEGFQAWAQAWRERVDAALQAHFESVGTGLGQHSRLPEAIQYSLRIGGKRLRPMLVLESCVVCGGDWQRALPAALAIEMVHTFSLIHDDLPAMDDDDLRRGQPTNHKVYGEALAVLAGDFLMTHAISCLTRSEADAHVIGTLVRDLTCGTEHMILGQGADIEGEGRPVDADRVRYIHAHKTSALIETACRLGALCASADARQLEQLADYGRHLGLAFQITDDLLDETGTEQNLGKRVHKDANVAKQTYPAAFGLDASRQAARVEIDAAVAALEMFGARAARLRDLARFVVTRDR